MPSGSHQSQYNDAVIASVEMVCGDGFMSPGGEQCVARIVEGLDICGKKVLEVGCGLGGVLVALVRNHDAGSVHGMDLEASVPDQWGQVLNLEFSKSLIILSTIDLFEIQDSRPDPLVALEGPQCVVTSAAQDLIASGRVSPSRTPVTCTWVAIYGQQRAAKLII